MAFTEAEKERIRYHLGYLETSLAPSIAFGIPKPLQTVFLLEDSLGLIQNPYAADRVRHILCLLESLEKQLFEAVKTTAASELGTMKLHPLAAQGKLYTDSIEKEYGRWARRLADIMGVPLYPYSARFKKSGPGSSIPVS